MKKIIKICIFALVFCQNLMFAGSFDNGKLDFIASEMESYDEKNTSEDKRELLEKMVAFLENKVVQKLNKKTARLEKYKNDETNDPQVIQIKIASLQEKIDNLNKLLKKIQTWKTKLKILSVILTE